MVGSSTGLVLTSEATFSLLLLALTEMQNLFAQ